MNSTEQAADRAGRDGSNDTDQIKKDSCTYAEPLPESSRPRRDGPGGN